MYGNGPKSLKIVQKAILLHTLRGQGVPLRLGTWLSQIPDRPAQPEMQGVRTPSPTRTLFRKWSKLRVWDANFWGRLGDDGFGASV